MNKARARGTNVTILPTGSSENDAADYGSSTFSYTGVEGGGAEVFWRSPFSDSNVFMRPTFPGEMTMNVDFANSADPEAKKILISNTVSFDVNIRGVRTGKR